MSINLRNRYASVLTLLLASGVAAGCGNKDKEKEKPEAKPPATAKETPAKEGEKPTEAEVAMAPEKPAAASIDAGATEPAAPAKPAIDFAKDFAAAAEPMDLAGCPYVSADHNQLACWHLELDMGFGALSLDFYDASKPGKPERVDIFGRNDNEDDWVKREDNMAKVQERFTKASFYSVAWGKPGKAVRLAATAKLKLPTKNTSEIEVPLLDEKRPDCCKWMVKTSAAKDAEGLKLLHAYGDCDYVDKEGDACHETDYNDESYTFQERYVLVKE